MTPALSPVSRRIEAEAALALDLVRKYSTLGPRYTS